VYCTDHVPPTHRVISFLTSRHGHHTMLQHPPLACACAELLVSLPPCNPTQPRCSQASSTSLPSHTTMPTHLPSCARRSLSTVASTVFHEQLDCLMQSTVVSSCTNIRRPEKQNSKVHTETDSELVTLSFPFLFPCYTRSTSFSFFLSVSSMDTCIQLPIGAVQLWAHQMNYCHT
jgi:hypothetical protein